MCGAVKTKKNEKKVEIRNFVFFGVGIDLLGNKIMKNIYFNN
jgi:hypothetical protein